MCLLQRGLNDTIKISYKWWNKTEKNIQACVNQEIRKWQKIGIFLLFQVLWRRGNTIVTIVPRWWLSIFDCQHGHWRSCLWCSQPKTLGGQCLTLGKQQHFCLGRHFSKHKRTSYAKIWDAWPPGLPLATPMGSALLVFHENFAHSAIFYIISRIHVYFTKSGNSNTTRAWNLTNKKSTEYKFKTF